MKQMGLYDIIKIGRNDVMCPTDTQNPQEVRTLGGF